MITTDKIKNELYVWIWERGLKKLLYKRWLDRDYGVVMDRQPFSAKDTDSFKQSIKTIQTNELRIGNLIASDIKYNSTSIIGKVLEIGNNEREFEQIYCECAESFEWFFKNSYCGIPLTAKWLIKFGFTHVYGNIYKKVIHQMGTTELKALAVYLDENNYCVALVDYYTGKEKTELLHLDYQFVHSLQNLYYMFTHTELPFTEDMLNRYDNDK